MTISNANRLIEYPGNGSTTAFTFNWRIIAESDLGVVLRLADDSVVAKTLTTHYTVSGVGAASGTVTMLVAPASGQTLSIFIAPPFTQLASYPEGGKFPSATHESALDRLVNLCKHVLYRVDRALRIADGAADAYDAGSTRIKNVADPEEDQDAATMAYVDAEIAAVTLDPTTPVTPYAATLLDDATAAAARTTLGATSVGAAVFTAADTQAALEAIGIEAEVRSALDIAPDAEGFLTLLGVQEFIAEPNQLIDGDFQVPQFGIAINGASTPANNDATYFHAAWRLLSNGNDKVDLDFESVDVPSGAKGALKLTAQTTEAAGAAKFGVIQFLEARDSIALRVKAVSLSGSIKALGGLTLTGFRVHLISWASTANAPYGTHPVGTWNAGTTNIVAGANHTIVGSATITATSDHAEWNLDLQPVPVGCNNLGILIVTHDAAWTAGDGVILSKIKIEEGSVHTPFKSLPIAHEIARCERLYTKTFPLATAPVTNSGSLLGALHAQMHTMQSGDEMCSVQWNFRAPMRIAPNVLTYSPSAATTDWDEVAGAGTLAATVLNAGESGVFIYSATNASSNARYAIHATADARLS